MTRAMTNTLTNTLTGTVAQQTTPLTELQRDMAAAVMTPLTAHESMRRFSSDGRAMSDIAQRIIAPNSRLTAAERLEIYNRQYWFRVLGALAEDFPALRALLGSRRFDALAVPYLTAHPSRSFTLRNLGSHLVEWLSANPRYTGRRHSLAMDISRVEWAFIEAFDEAELPPLTVEQIAALHSDSRLALQPHVRLLALTSAADELAISLHTNEKKQAGEAGVKGADEVTPPATIERMRRRPIWVAAHRVDLSVYYRRLAQEEYLTLSAIRQGQSLGLAIESGFTHSTMSTSRRAGAVQRWFAAWAELGWLCAPEQEP